MGIIDYFRCYDIIKKLENSVKSVGMIIGEKEPTVIPPNLYKKRFRLSMDNYFISVSFVFWLYYFADSRSIFLFEIN